MDGIENPSQELAALKAEFDTIREQQAELRSALESMQQPQPSGIDRRGLMAGGGLGLLGLLAASGNAAGAVDPNDGDGDLGTNANPWDVWADGLALVAEDVSTSTTVTKPIVRYDSALSSLTLQIDSSLEGPSGFGQPMWFLDQSGNADSNPVTVENSSGGTVATIPAENSILEIVWDGSEWLTDRFIPSVDAGTVTAGTIDNDGSAISLSDTLDSTVNSVIQRGGDGMIWARALAGGNQGLAFHAATKGDENTGDLNNNGLVWSLDESNNNLEFTVQYSDGSQLTGTVSLS